MNSMETINKGFTVIYNNKDGSIGFIGIDDHSGGYPWFSSFPEGRHIFKDIEKAQKLLKTGQDMLNYYGNEKVDFSSMRIVKYTQVFQTVSIDDLDMLAYESAMAKLSEEEIAAVAKFLKQ